MQMTASQRSGWQSHLLTIMPAIQKQLSFAFRKMSRIDREEASQEAVAEACRSLQDLARRGKLHVAYATTIACYAVRHVRGGRHVGAAQDRAQDVLSPCARHRGRVRVCRIDESGTGGAEWRRLLIADRKTDIPSLTAFKIDFGAWLGSFTERDRRIITALGDGDRPSAVAKRFNVSPGRITQLRRRFEASWCAYQGELLNAAV
jgi:hypothetical protein